MNLQTFLAGYKTYLTAAAGVIAALIAYSNGTATLYQTGFAIFIALQTVFLRAGIKVGVTAIIARVEPILARMGVTPAEVAAATAAIHADKPVTVPPVA